MRRKRRNTSSGPFGLAAAFLCIGLWTLSGAAASASAQDCAGPTFDARLAELEAIHPAVRKTPVPGGGKKVAVNPPPLLWPSTSGSRTRYEVRLSQDPKFPAAATVAASGLRWALFNPHRKLAFGTWYWQYGAVPKPGEKPRWSEVYRFEVDGSARRFVTPPASAMIAACPKGHPRVLIAPGELAALRSRLKRSGDAERIASKTAARYVGRQLPAESQGRPTQKGADPFQAKNFAKWASKAYAAHLASSTVDLAAAYLVTGDEPLGREAARRAVFIAGLDPDGVTSRSTSDFADGSCMRAMALGYDSCYELLSEGERQQLREAMTVRGGRFFNRLMNNLETKVFSAHVWQHILSDGADVAFATLGEVPEAELWASYVYEVWIARFPLLGGGDGGWANGLNYFGTNFATLLAMPSLFERLTGVDFFDQPWYRNTIYYQLYGWPPGSASDGFGDGGERESPPSGSRAAFIGALGRRFGDPYALWYARQILGERGGQVASPWELLRSAGLEGSGKLPPPEAPGDLPQARLFRDVGIVSMHTALGDCSRDLMIGFRSSPYGSYNHMHADQNSFNVLFGGQRLFSNSGYYIGYGDAHFKGWYTATRGHNSVLIDGRGQVRGADGFGLVTRFLDGRQISYCLGDASRAYGDAGLTRFRRHLALLRPGVIVVYDELEADHEAEWSWLLHSKCEMTVDTAHQRITAAIPPARAQVDLLGSTPLELSVDDRFDPPAVNWRKKTSGGHVIQYPNQWHATVKPRGRSPRARFLAVIQVRPAGQTAAFDDPASEQGGWVRVGGWRIQAELDTSHAASLLIERADGQAALAADKETVVVGAKRWQLPKSTSILVEADRGIVRQCRDELPEAVR